MEENIVVFKGSVNGLTIIMKEEVNFLDCLNEIEKKIASAGRFFKGAILNVKYRGKKLSQNEESEVFKLLSDKSGAKIKGIEEDFEFEESKKMEKTSKKESLLKRNMKKLHFTGIDEGDTKFYRGTVRSGQLIKFEGNVVIVGDVNPGGEISSTGNTIVMGALRGIVHAGADGNKNAVVVAFNLQPTQLRIADVITRSPDEPENNEQIIPELACIRDELVYIERYLPQR